MASGALTADPLTKAHFWSLPFLMHVLFHTPKLLAGLPSPSHNPKFYTVALRYLLLPVISSWPSPVGPVLHSALCHHILSFQGCDPGENTFCSYVTWSSLQLLTAHLSLLWQADPSFAALHLKKANGACVCAHRAAATLRAPLSRG